MTQTILDMKGHRFGRLLVIEFVGKDRHRKAVWKCLCDCGKNCHVPGTHLRSGNTTSCGCYQKDAVRTHGLSRVGCKEYRTWAMMISRCHNPKTTGYANYGGRGIRVCDRWLSFENFLGDMGRKPSSRHTIDRIDNDGNYEPGNCRWATKHEQDTNRRQTRLITLNGETLCIKDWARRFEMPYDVLLTRLDKGMTLEDALRMPVKKYKPRKTQA